MKQVILVESPTKAKTLTRFLKGKYAIEASMGHIRDLPKGKLGLDMEHDFAPQYVTPRDKAATVKRLKTLVKGATSVFLATDPDREGEAISNHLYHVLKETTDKKTQYKRIVFHEITEEAINEALKKPREIDQHLVSAQTARRVLDRIVGYKLSPLLWKKIKRNLSAGRVQSVALRVIVEREREIEKFQKVPYFRVFITLRKTNGKDAEFELVQIDDKKVEASEKINLYDGEYKFSKTIITKEKADQILSSLKTRLYEVTDVNQKDTKRSPYPPFITSTLQIEGARRLGYSSKRTMSLAQKLYEEGFITYHRTDSFNLSNQFLTKARSFIKSEFGDKYLQERTFQTKSKVAQEAHEAIRPTTVESLEQAKRKIEQVLGSDAIRVYELIYKRAVATQMADSIFKATKIQVKSVNGQTYLFEKSGSVLVFDGFLKLWFYEESDNLLPEFSVGEKITYETSQITSHETNSPPRYNEASIISTLEKNGIGRPSTYATIVSTIVDRDYVEKQEAKFVPTSIGTIVNDFLVKNFSNIDDIPFTAHMEDDLDSIANGDKEWVATIREFYEPFEKELIKGEGEEKIEIKEETTGRVCPKCGKGELVVRKSRFGKFVACNQYPECKYKENLVEDTHVSCPKDGGKVVMKKTRTGRTFFGCSNYPNCDFAVWNKSQLPKPAEPTNPDTTTNK